MDAGRGDMRKGIQMSRSQNNGGEVGSGYAIPNTDTPYPACLRPHSDDITGQVPAEKAMEEATLVDKSNPFP